ncbi:hypothetical protein ES702_05085 [subsurface metagenome]
MAKEAKQEKVHKCRNCGATLGMSDDDTGHCPACGLVQSVSAKKK